MEFNKDTKKKERRHRKTSVYKHDFMLVSPQNARFPNACHRVRHGRGEPVDMKSTLRLSVRRPEPVRRTPTQQSRDEDGRLTTELS